GRGGGKGVGKGVEGLVPAGLSKRVGNNYAPPRGLAWPATGHVRVTVADQAGAPVPARVAAVGFDPSPEVILAGNTGLFSDQVEALPFGYAYIGYTESNGVAAFDLEPSVYQLVVSRGVEYSVFSQQVTVGS